MPTGPTGEVIEVPDEERITVVRSETSGTPGRSLNRARTNHFVVDEPTFAGGPGEAVTPEESFLAGVSACGVMLVEAFADEAGYPLEEVRCEIRGVRDSDDPADYKRVELDFAIEGVTRKQAETLVERYRGR